MQAVLLHLRLLVRGLRILERLVAAEAHCEWIRLRHARVHVALRVLSVSLSAEDEVGNNTCNDNDDGSDNTANSTA